MLIVCIRLCFLHVYIVYCYPFFVWRRCVNTSPFVVWIGPFDWLLAYLLAPCPLRAPLLSHEWCDPRKSLLDHRGFKDLISVMMMTMMRRMRMGTMMLMMMIISGSPISCVQNCPTICFLPIVFRRWRMSRHRRRSSCASVARSLGMQPVWLKCCWVDLYVLDKNWRAACEGIARILETRCRPKPVAKCIEKGSLASISVHLKGGVRDS